jgi:hypothetical protein
MADDGDVAILDVFYEARFDMQRVTWLDAWIHA